MYSPYPHQVQGGAGQPGHHASLPAYNPNMNTSTAGLVQNPSHHQPQPQHHMMYNPHQYAHQSPYGAGNPIMTGMPQMHNGGMAHSGGNSNGVPHYQTPYTSSPYGSGIPTSASGPGQPQGYQAPFAMNMQQQQQQHMSQRMQMQPPPPSSTPNSHSGGPSRASPYAPPALPHQMTPPNASNPQFAPHPSQTHQQNLQGQQQQSIHQSHQGIPQSSQNHGQNQQQTTPSTPTFVPPLSPASESLEKERVSMLLDINQDLLMEILRLQALQAEIKKELEAEPNNDPERRMDAVNDFRACMHRVQANLAYLATMADRQHKPNKILPHPAIMVAPPLSHTTTTHIFTSSPVLLNATPNKGEDPNSPSNPPSASKSDTDVSIDKESRADSLMKRYKKLQELFNMQEADLKREMKKEAESFAKAKMQHAQGQQGFSLNQQMQSPVSGGQQRLPGQQMPLNMLQNNMASQMQGQGQQMNMASNSAMAMPSMSLNPNMMGTGGMGMEMGFQRGMQR